MAVKTFVPQLIRLLGHLCRYIAKRRAVLEDVLTAPELILLDGIVTACNAFTSQVSAPIEAP